MNLCKKVSLVLLLPIILVLATAFFATQLDWDVSLQADHAIAADDSHLGRGTALHDTELRNDCGRGKGDLR